MMIDDRIRHILDSTDLTDPREIAAKVDAEATALEKEEAWPTMLADHVRLVMGGHLGRYGRLGSPDRTKVTSIPSDGPPGPGTPLLTRADRIREAALRQRLHAGPGVWAMLGDFTIGNHEFAAAERETMAAGNLAAARWFEECARAQREHGADRFRDLPAEVLTTLLAGRP